MHWTDFMSTTDDIKPYYSQSNSNSSNQDNSLDDYVVISSSASTVIVQNNSSEENVSEQEDDSDYYAQFSWPDDSDDDLGYLYDDNNDDLYINNHLDRKQLNLIDHFDEKTIQRSKRSNKKMNAQRQIKTKYAKSIKYKSHNKQLYMHHRLFKQVQLDPPRCHYMPSDTPRSLEAIRPSVYERHQQRQQQPVSKNHNQSKPAATRPEPSNQFREYTINEHNIPNEPSFDDAMIIFLLEMQNRDLSPNDYEMLLRLDERIQRKTLNRNILDTLPTLNVNETHAHDQCTICMETYILGQKLKVLPCTHIFHSNCIETYLTDFSTQCPLDNLPIV